MSELAASRLAIPAWQSIRSGALLFFGVGLPIAALAVELTTRLSAMEFFDPLPTPLHAFLVAFVALANTWCWFVVWQEKTAQARWAARANGFAIGIAAFYSVLFLPLLPLGAIGIFLYGLGALVWAPLASLIVALRLRVHLKRDASERGIALRFWPGIVLGLAALIALDLPATITRIGARMAVSNSVETRARGLRLLRAIGSQSALLRMTYVRSTAATDMLSFLLDLERPIDLRETRELYYRVTGRSFNTELPPRELSRRGRFFDRWGDLDVDQGGSVVGGRVTNLALVSSRLDGSVSADAALGYLEWTMVFGNSAPMQGEARAEIALPPGAVVSRVTLWINGEEREAAFAGRGQVRQAYESVVHRNRDPVLVTSAGPDRVAMQLFPVPPGGDMKVRIGMTVPLGLSETREAVLRMPYFHERNFGIGADLRHSVWIESKAKLHSALALTADAGSGVVRAEIDDARLTSDDASIFAPRSEQNAAWSPDTHAGGQVVRQVINDEPVQRPRRLVIVVDGSRSMRDVAATIAKNLEAIPADVNVRLIFAHDESERDAEIPTLSAADASKQIASFQYVGGNDNTAALVRGLDLAFEQPESVLLWVHGPQPERLERTEALLQRLERGPKSIRWYDLQVSPGPNFVSGIVDGAISIDTLRSDDLPRIVTAWRTGKGLPTVRRERVAAGAATLFPASERTSDHLVRLWANDEVTRMIHSKADRRADAVALAHEYQLVTPVSGAVVLETQQQYDANGLQPVPAGTVPSIPEPEEWALMIVALLVLIYAYRRRHAFISARAA